MPQKISWLGLRVFLGLGLLGLFLSTFLPKPAAWAAGTDGTPDPTFLAGSGLNATVRTQLILPNGNILLGGDFTSYNNTPVGRLVSLKNNGALDPSFNAGGTGANGQILALAYQSDGKIWIGGDFTTYNGITRTRLARLNADGSLDTTFDPGAGANRSVSGIVLQPDGKVIVWGTFNYYNDVNRHLLFRLNANGTLEETFNNGSGFLSRNENAASIRGISLQSDGKLVLSGNIGNYNGVDVTNKVMRLNADGTRDLSFSIPVWVNYAEANLIQPDGKIIFNGIYPVTKRLYRFNPDGTTDTSFTVGTSSTTQRFAMALQPDGKILVGTRNFTDYNGATVGQLVRVNPDGSLDTAFQANAGAGINGFVLAISVQPDGKIVVSGDIYSYNNVPRSKVVRLNTDGTLDTSFAVGATKGADSTVYKVATQAGGKILAVGGFTTFNGLATTGAVSLNPTGEVAATFDVLQLFPGKVFLQTTDTAFQPDGKILLTGYVRDISTNAYVTLGFVYRANPDGSPDPTFAATLAGSQIDRLILQPDGKILVMGVFSSYKGTASKYLVRLNSDGTVDNTFVVGTSFDSSIDVAALQPDGKILVAGMFIRTYNGVSVKGFARLNADGSLDTSFAPTQTIAPSAITVQPNGQILAGYSSANPASLWRLNTDGSRDSSFETSFTNSGFLGGLAVQSNGQILVAGRFGSTNGQNRSNIARLNPDGTLDSNFDAGTSSNGVIYSLALQADNKILAGGDFTLFNGLGYQRLARLENSNRTLTNLALTSSANPVLQGSSVTFTATISPATATGTVNFTFSSGASVSSPLFNGVATYMTTTLPAGVLTITATYSGDANFAGTTKALTQVVTAACNPLVVTLVTDDGTGATCGTFSHALTQATSGQTVTFALTAGSTVTFTGSLSPNVPSGVTLDGGANGLTLNGNGAAGDGLRLSGGDTLRNLTIRRFAGRELVFLGGGNKLYKVRLES